MLAVGGRYDGKVVVLDKPVTVESEAKVLVLFRKAPRRTLEETQFIRRQLRGSGKGLNLVDKLLAERKRDGFRNR